MTTSPTYDMPDVVRRFLDAVAAMDADALADCFTEDGQYFLKYPDPAVVGRNDIRDFFADLFPRCTQARWDVESAATSGSTVYLERIDRFWFDGKEVFIECIGVLELRNGLIWRIRDYGDAETWTKRLDAVLGAADGERTEGLYWQESEQ